MSSNEHYEDHMAEKYEYKQTNLDKGIWVTLGGAVLNIKTMGPLHIANCITMLMQGDFKAPDMMDDWIRKFTAELKRREDEDK